jgi:hypothetical protein
MLYSYQRVFIVRSRLLLATILLVLTLVLNGCAEPSIEPFYPSDTNTEEPFHPADTNTKFHLVDFYSFSPAIIVVPLGEEINYEWTVMNSATEAITVRITITQVADSMNNAVLQYNDGYEFDLATGDRQELIITWNQKNDSGLQVDPGEYKIGYICSAWKISEAPEESCQTFEDTVASIIIRESESAEFVEPENQPTIMQEEPFELHPQPNSDDIRRYTTISATLPKGYRLLDMKVEPSVDLAYVGEYGGYSEGTKYIGYPSSILEDETTYNVSIKYTDKSGPLREYTWKFTTHSYGLPDLPPAPEPEGNDVSINTPISISFHRFSGYRGASTNQEWAKVSELITIPSVTIGQVTLEDTLVLDVCLTFYLKEPLKTNTTYTIIYTTEPKLSCYTWSFNTSK